MHFVMRASTSFIIATTLSLGGTSFGPLPTAFAVSLSEPKPTQLKLQLPNNRQTSFDLQERHNSHIRWYYSGEVLDGLLGPEWVENLPARLELARAHFERARSRGLLPDCTTPLNQNRKQETIILLDSLTSHNLKDSPERAGYHHPSNPGPIIETQMWNDQGIETLILHEMVHHWCKSNAATQSTRNRWFEEGVADWVPFATTGAIPQSAITKYFAQPCQPTLYGSSFLWVLANMLARDNEEQGASPSVKPSVAQLLALLHLGHRNSLGNAVTQIYGKIPHVVASACPTTNPPVAYGLISSHCASKKTKPGSPEPSERKCLPLTKKNWGFELGEKPDAFFIWLLF